MKIRLCSVSCRTKTAAPFEVSLLSEELAELLSFVASAGTKSRRSQVWKQI
jgi:hypothetical protein